MKQISKSKKGFVWFIPLIYILLSILLLGLLIWGGYKLSSAVSGVIDFLMENWWILIIAIILILYRGIITALIKKLFRV